MLIILCLKDNSLRTNKLGWEREEKNEIGKTRTINIKRDWPIWDNAVCDKEE